MRTLLITAAATLIMASACSSNKKEQAQEAEALTPAQTLIALLDSTVNSGRFYYGHHDDTAYGHDWKYEEGRSDVKEMTGEYPGLMSWDLGMLELDSANNLDGVPFTFIAEQVAAQNARGGINAISWHPRNPITGGDSWDTSASPLHEIAENEELAKTVDSWIGKAADFINSLQDADGNKIPVIFRPWHENSGTWFWWGAGNSTPEEYIAFYKRTRKIFDEKGVDNVVWAYSPDKDLTPEEYFKTYPGDEYVDILGSDIYQFGEEGVQEYRDRVSRQLPFVVEEAKKRGKIAALSETGLEGMQMDNWYSEVLLPLVKDLPIAYVCVWRNAVQTEKPGHFYAPYPGHPAEKDFMIFYESPKTIFVK